MNLMKIIASTKRDERGCSRLRKARSYFRLPTSDFRLPTSDFRLRTFDFRLPTSDLRLLTLISAGCELGHKRMEVLIPLELLKAREAYLIDRGQTLEPLGLNRRDET